MKSIIFVFLLIVLRVAAQPNIPGNKQILGIADFFQYQQFFKETSDLSVIITTCGGPITKMELVIKSFFYFNTYPIKKMFIAHCQKGLNLALILPIGYLSYSQFFEVLELTEQNKGLTEALINIYQKIKTKYVYQTDGRWLMVKGFGFIEESIKVLKHGEAKNIKMAQVTPNFPYWRALAKLSKLQWSQTNQAYHLIMPFNNEKFLHFTTSPTVFEFSVIYQKILEKQIKKVCESYKCIKQNLKNNFDYDKCCIWAIGQQIKLFNYSQIYINDGTSEPHHEFFVEEN